MISAIMSESTFVSCCILYNTYSFDYVRNTEECQL